MPNDTLPKGTVAQDQPSDTSTATPQDGAQDSGADAGLNESGTSSPAPQDETLGVQDNSTGEMASQDSQEVPEPVVEKEDITRSATLPADFVPPSPGPAPVVETTVVSGADSIKIQQDLAEAQSLIEQGLDVFSPEVRAMIGDVIATGAPISKISIQEILNYVKLMDPKRPTDEVTGNNAQRRLYNTLLNAINNGAEDWAKFFGTYLAMVNDLKADHAFHPVNVFRFLPTVTLNAAQRQTFQNLLQLSVHTSDYTSRGLALRQIDLSKSVDSEFITDAGRNRILGFYSRFKA